MRFLEQLQCFRLAHCYRPGFGAKQAFFWGGATTVPLVSLCALVKFFGCVQVAIVVGAFACHTLASGRWHDGGRVPQSPHG